MQLYYGVVENRKDPLKLGRCQVRIVGLHTHDKATLPTEDLPWATPMQPVTSAAMNGIGWSPVGPVEGTSVIITFADLDQQQPIMLGTIGGIPQSKAASIALEDSGNIATDGGVITAPDGKPITKADGTPTTLGNRVEAVGKQVTTAVNQEIQGIKNKMAALTAAAFGDKFGNLFGTPAAAKVETKTLPIEGTADESKPTIIPPAPAPADTSIKAQPEPGKADPKVLQTPINLEPMPKYVAKGQEGRAKQGIAALVAACDKLGLTSKYAKASILGICGGETGWVPKEEMYGYPAASLLRIFPSIFQGNQALAQEYSGKNKTKEEFFELIYGNKYAKGQGLGNKAPGDGGKYFGRGFNQLTGKANYLKTQNELQKYGIVVDLVNQPQKLNDDLDVAALACVLFYKNHPTLKNANSDDPGYFVKARAATGADAGGGYEKKQIMYEYFLGQSVLASPTTRTSTEDETGKKYTAAEVSQLPKEKQDALLEDRSENATIGFKDPKGKYPLRNLLNEPDTNRLARGVIQETAIAYKDQTRSKGIPAPFGGSFEQPIAPYGGVYPFNKVYETETGHVLMFDDSTGHETVSITHRKGTFLDIDANGTQVNKIVGDGYTIYDRNGAIYVAGKCNLTVGNSVNILVQGDANIEVNGQTQAKFHGQVDIGCAKDVNLAVGGDWNISVGGSINTYIGENKVTTVIGNENKDVTGNRVATVKGNQNEQVTGNIVGKAGGYIAYETADEFTAKAAAAMKLTGSEQHILASGGNVNVHGDQFHGQEGSAQEADAVADVENVLAEVIDAPSGAESSGDKFETLTTPVRPSTPVDVKVELVDDFLKQAESAQVNPELDGLGVGAAASKPQPVTSADPPAGETQSMADGDLVAFLRKQEQLGKEGYWTERAMKSGKVEDSNPNIIAIWKDIGLYGPIVTNPVQGKSGFSAGGDQTAWCMAFATWCLKQTGHKWVKTASAADATNQMQKFGFTKVTDKPQNGDVMHIKFNGGGNHVAFVWDVQPSGKFTMLGGNQGGTSSGNNPSGGQVKGSFNGLVTMSGYGSVFSVIGIYRPSKV